MGSYLFIIRYLQIESDIEADMEAVDDRNEPVSMMEPMIFGSDSRHRSGSDGKD